MASRQGCRADRRRHPTRYAAPASLEVIPLETLLLLACGGVAGGFCYVLLAPRGFQPAVRRTPPWQGRLEALRAAAGRLATGTEPLALAGVSE